MPRPLSSGPRPARRWRHGIGASCAAVMTCGIVAVCLAAGAGSAVPQASPAAEQGYRDGVYHVSLDAIRKELAEAKKFPVTSEIPSPYLSDFFGLQRVADLPPAEIIKDLAPGAATVLSETPLLKLRFSRAYTVVYYFKCVISIDGGQGDSRLSFVEIVDFKPAFKDRYEALQDFIKTLERLGLAGRQLVANPYAAEERTAAAALASETRPRPAGWPQRTAEERARLKDEALAGFEKASRGILMFGDTHGSEESYGVVWDYLAKLPWPTRLDWIGLEMIPCDMQAVVDDFIGRDGASPEFKAAEAKLKEHFAQGWDKRFAAPADSGEGHYYRILAWARAHAVRVYALDAPGEYTLFRYGEFPLGATTRNIVWSEIVPLEGRGIVYGGSAHFVPLPATPFTFQDYVRRRNPKIDLFLVQ